MTTFWKPGTIAPGSSIDRDTNREVEDSVTAIYNPKTLLSIQDQRKALPVYKVRDQLLYLVEKYQVVIVVGQTGSGKTTQIPQYLHEAGWTQGHRIVACTQPRRVAATSIATRVAEEMDVQLGQEVGYSVRFDEIWDTKLTRIKYMTDGMLFRETLLDPLLKRYSVIMIDEAHERSLYTDILLGVLKKILKKRNDLKIIISSATLDAQEFHRFFNKNVDSTKDSATIMSIQGRMYPVDIHYLNSPCNDYVVASVETVLSIHQSEGPGDILVFLTGQEDIHDACSMISEALNERNQRLKLLILPLYGGLLLEEQLKVFQPAPEGYRKCIISTNVAEASVTIDGVVYVVDSGFVKMKAYNPMTSTEALIITPISQASAQQRAGRAGRTRSGKAYRLYTESDFHQLSPSSIPEMQRSNLATVILQLKAIGIENVLYFDFLSPPPAEMMTRALELLYSLNALDDYARLTMPFGMNLAEFPLDPLLASCLLNSWKFNCSEEMVTIASILSVQNVFVQPAGKLKDAEDERQKFAVEEGDHITYLNVYQAFIKNRRNQAWCHRHFLNYKSLLRAVSIRAQLVKYLKRLGIEMKSCGIDTESLRKCLVTGYFSHAAKLLPDGSYASVRDELPLLIHPNSVLFNRSPHYVIYHEVVETSKAYMRDVTVIQGRWLIDLAPHYYQLKPTLKATHF